MVIWQSHLHIQDTICWQVQPTEWDTMVIIRVKQSSLISLVERSAYMNPIYPVKAKEYCQGYEDGYNNEGCELVDA